MLRKHFYPTIEPKLNQAAEFLHKQGFTPNQLTMAGLAINFLAGCIYATGAFFLGGLVLIIASAADMLDGPLARLSGKSSPFGAFLDSTVDRYSDFFAFAGVSLFFARENQGSWLLISLGILLGAFVTSYTKARAESLIESCPVGLFERPERIMIFAFGSIFWPLMPICLWILLVGTHWTALERVFYTQKKIAEKANPE